MFFILVESLDNAAESIAKCQLSESSRIRIVQGIVGDRYPNQGRLSASRL
jgi:hypothetical protein